MTDQATTPADLANDVRAPTAPAGRGPWATALRKLRSDRAAMAALLLFLLVVVALPAGAGLCEVRRQYRSVPLQSRAARSSIDGKSVPVMQPSTEGLGLGFTPIGPTWDFARLFPRRRRPGPRRGGAPALWRAQLAPHRRRVDGDLPDARRHRRPRRRLLRRRRRLGAVAPARRALGLSGLSAGHLAFDRADQPRHRHRPHLDRVRQPVRCRSSSSASSTCPMWRGRSAARCWR